MVWTGINWWDVTIPGPVFTIDPPPLVLHCLLLEEAAVGGWGCHWPPTHPLPTYDAPPPTIVPHSKPWTFLSQPSIPFCKGGATVSVFGKDLTPTTIFPYIYISLKYHLALTFHLLENRQTFWDFILLPPKPPFPSLYLSLYIYLLLYISSKYCLASPPHIYWWLANPLRNENYSFYLTPPREIGRGGVKRH